MSYVTDLHTHPTFKPYNNIDDPSVNIWDPIAEKTEHYDALPNVIRPVIHETARTSQSNLNALIMGKVRGVFFVLHPIEMGWFIRTKKSPHPLRKKLLKKILTSENERHLAASMAGISIDKVDAIRKAVKDDDAIDYYNSETYPEYLFLKNSENVTGTNGSKLKLVSNYAEFKDIIDNHPGTIAGIVTIEGGHALGNFPKISLTNKTYDQLSQADQRHIKNKYFLNIKKIKGLNQTNGFEKEHTPFCMTAVHMYNNFLGGHAKSYREGTGLMPGMDDLLDQSTAMYTGMTSLGKKVIERLLKYSNDEKRILIDVKHMSLQMRKDYYEIVKAKRKTGDQIPIIFSHGGVNGYSQDVFPGYDANNIDSGAYISHWSINLYNEDIKEIYDSGGVIGLAPHEGRIPGDQAKQIFRDLKRSIGWHDNQNAMYKKMLQEEYIRLFLTNVFHIVSVINDKKAWDMICIGSDYDGIMDPFNTYPKSNNFLKMLGDIKSFLDDSKSGKVYRYQGQMENQMPRSKMKDLMFGLSSSEIIKKIGYKNAENFLQTYFNDQYRHGILMA